MELQDYLRILKRNWALITVITLVVTGLAAAWTMTRTPVYQAESKLYVSVRTGETKVGDLQQGVTYARQAVSSYVDIVRTSIVTDKVAEELGNGLTSRQISKKVNATSPANTVLISISATDTDPELAAKISNTTARVFSEVVTQQLEKPSEGSPARVTVDIVQPAQVPAGPISPRPFRNLALGILLGFAIGIGTAILRSILDTRVSSRSDLEQATDVPILGGVMRDPNASQRPLIVQDDPHGPRAEAFRQLRTNLQFLRVEGNPRSFVFTSAGAAEGKTTTAANLAIALSETNSTVCLVDGDLRKPRVAEVFGIEGGVGLTDVLIGRVSPETAIQPWGKNKLHILPSGQRPPNPAELLGSEEFERLVIDLTSVYDYVIIDAPPLLAVTDAALISQIVGGALVAVAVGQTRKPQLSAALEQLNAIDSRVLGMVMTKVPEKGPDSYGFSYYTYGDVHKKPTKKAAKRSDVSDGAKPILGS